MREGFLVSLGLFAQHFAAGALLVVLFVLIYSRLTPHKELALIRGGNAAAATGLLGAVLGFMLPLTLVFSVTADPVEAAIWGAIALVVQVAAHLLSWWLFPSLPKDITEGRISAGLVQAGVGVTVGLIAAASLTP